jgi:Fic family protein
VEQTARSAVRQASRLMDLREIHRERLGKKLNALRLLDELFVNPYLTAARAAQILTSSRPTARQAIGLLQTEGLLEEVTGRSWRRIYLARPILEVIEERV